MARPARAVGWFIASVIGHLALASVSAVLVARQMNAPPAAEVATTFPPPPPDGPILVELPTSMGDTVLASAWSPDRPPPIAPAGAAGAPVPRADDGAGGKGGGVGEKATNLSSANADQTSSESLQDSDQDQQNHLKSDKRRASPLDVRHALVPMELTFVSSGKGFRYERRPVASRDAALGVGATPAVVLGGAPGGAPGAGNVASLGAVAGGKPNPIPGVSYGSVIIGTPQLIGAPVAKARPHVQQGKPTVVAGDKGPTKDDQDADQAVKDALKSVVSTSPVGAASAGVGKGGSEGPGAVGAGGDTSGSASLALGAGGEGPSASKRTRWFLDLQKRIGPLVDKTFPKEAELELRQGVVVVELTIDKAGKVLDVIVVRESGFAEFDKKVVARLRAAPSFDPVPDLVGGGPVRVRLPVQGGWVFQ